MEYDRRVDPDKYAHKWLGQCVKNSEAQVFFGKWSVDEIEAPQDIFFYFGADWGFAKDPTTLVRCFVKDNFLYVDKEFYGIGVEINNLPSCFDTIEESKNYPIIGDSARPDTISYLRNHGYNKIQPSQKTEIKDGVEFLKSFEKIIISPNCKHTIDEFRHYSYVVDNKTGLISNKIEDKNNHIIDAIRYALIPLMRMAGGKKINIVGI
jgi:phage terminase large subunit